MPSSSSSSFAPAPPFTPVPVGMIVTYRDYSFAVTGRAQFARKVKFEIDSPGSAARRAVVTYEIQHIFAEQSFADNQVRYAALRAALAVTEGLLVITDENGTVLFSQLARPGAFDYPLQWGQSMAEVTVTFEAFENLNDAGNSIDATYTPAGGSAVTLSNVVNWDEEIQASRYTFAVDERKETNGFVTCSGIIRADPTLPSAQRRAFLQGQLVLLKAAVDCKNGTLAYGSFSRLVRIDKFTPKLDNATDTLKWTMSFSYRLFPNGDYAEAEYTMSSRDDLARMETLTSVKGLIRADTSVDAYTKAAAIAAQYATGRVLTSDNFEEHRIDGADGADFIELNFTYEFRQTIGGATSYVLNVATKEDVKTGEITTTYSGTVTGTGTSAALAVARGLTTGHPPILIRSDETVRTQVWDGSGPQFIEVSFNYEYLGKSPIQFAQITVETDLQIFGAKTMNVSGYVTADTYANALTYARSFKMVGVLTRSERESSPTLYEAGNSLFEKIDFAYSYGLQRTEGSITYKVRTFIDYEKWEIRVSFTGSAFGPNEATADALINALPPNAYLPQQAKDERTAQYDLDPKGNQVFLSKEFNLEFFYTISESGPGGGEGGIQKAQYSLQNVYSVNKAKITEIPYDLPDVQTQVGWTSGRIVISGSVTALSQEACQNWARAKQSSSGEEDATEEKFEFEFAPKSGSQVKFITMTFTYARVIQQLLFTS